MERCPLGVPQRPELARLRKDRGIRSNRRVFRMPQVGADLEDQRRDMIEQTLRRKHVACVHGKQIQQPLEPASGERMVLRTHPFGDQISEVGRNHAGVRSEPRS